MALSGALRLGLACLLLCSAAPKPTCDPSACPPCPEGNAEGDTEGTEEGTERNAEGTERNTGGTEVGTEGNAGGTATPAAGGCCPPCPPPCPCPPYLESECEMQGFSSVPAGRSFYIDFARALCTCGPGGAITCAPRCPRPPPACRALGSPRADGCPQCVCFDAEGMAVPAGTATARGSQSCTCPALGGTLRCSPAAGGE